jgi:hypothetical protein
MAAFSFGELMYLSCEQRYNVAMKMLSIVEHMAFGGLRQPQAAIIPVQVDDVGDKHDSALNDMIREQLRSSNSDLMSGVGNELPG